MIMGYINHKIHMSTALGTLGLGIEDCTLLDPNLDIDKIALFHRQMANVLP
jgi:hypothetical protein